MSEEDIKKWMSYHVELNRQFESHLTRFGWKYMAGDNLTASDFILYAFYTQLALNNVKKHEVFINGLVDTLYEFSKLSIYLDAMGEHLQDYMATRPDAWL